MTGYMARMPRPSIRDESFILRGGLDLVTAAPRAAPGSLLAVLNYDAAEDGYKRSRGYERFDGKPKPHDASYWKLDFDAGTNDVTEDDIVVGGTSNAFGKALDTATVESGAFATNDADGYLLLEGVSGTFQNNEALAVNKIAFTSGGTDPIEVGDTITGSVSGSTAIVIGIILSSGNWNDGDAAGTLYARTLSAAFQAENLLVGGTDLATIAGDFTTTAIATADGTTSQRALSGSADDTAYQDAIETRRALIGTVPGGGQIRGVFTLNGVGYAFRDDAASGATSCDLYKATTEGWIKVAMVEEVAFTSGSTEPIEGETITGAVSGNTAVIVRVNHTSGTWGGGDAAGWLTIRSKSGALQAEDLNGSSAGANFATIGGDSSAVSLSPSGAWDFRIHNFFGASNLKRAYGADGVNTAIDFDGTYLAKIRTGMTTDTPNHLEIYKNHLFLSFPGGSVQQSSPATPGVWSAVLGANEIGMGADVTGFTESVNALSVHSRTKTAVLTGASSSDFALNPVAAEAGAVEWTVQKMNRPTFMDDWGVKDMFPTQNYGDWDTKTISGAVKPLLQTKKSGSVTPTASVRSRGKGLYRVFFSDNSGISIFYNGKNKEIMAFNYGIPVRCAFQGEDTSDDEVILFGSDDGYVYELDAGNSLDGAEMDYFARLAFATAGSPQLNKNWKSIHLAVDTQETITIGFGADFNYAASLSAPTQDFTLQGGGGFWDEDFWDEFEWDSPVKGEATARINNDGKNISAVFSGTAQYDEPHTLQAVTYLYSPRGIVR